MDRHSRLLAIAAVGLSLIALVSNSSVRAERLNRSAKMPRVVLWAWERPEDFRFARSEDVGVAFLAGTMYLREQRTDFHPRQQSLRVAPKMKLIAVIRVETANATLHAQQLQETQRRILEASSLPQVVGVQIDFDATRSERQFYRDLLVGLRTRLAASTTISITALSSWCIGDDWIAGLPIDEAVPMLFRMGTGQAEVTNWIGSKRDFREPLCRGSLGISLDEPWKHVPSDRRVYAFSPKPWTENSLEALYWEMDKWR